MDEQRMQAYIELIQALLSCPNGGEEAVLQQHPDLLDSGLVEVMGAVAQQFNQQGKAQEAAWLENMAMQLAQAIRLAARETSAAEQPSEQAAPDAQRTQAYVQVVQELLSCPNGQEPEVLQRHQSLVDAGLVQVMGQVAAVLRQQGQEDNANWLEQMAAQLAQMMGQGEASEAEPAMPGGLQAILQELSQPPRDVRGMGRRVQLCRQALELVSQQSNAPLWGALQFELGNRLYQNPLEDRAQNIEDAIAAYTLALQVRTRENFPQDWAATQNNLANAYKDRIREDRAQNLEKAISAYSQALEVYIPDAHPNNCRGTARLLANLYADQSRWSEAQTTYRTALTAAEILYQAALSKGSQEAELSATHDLYRRAAYAYAQAGDLQTAVATLEQGRARSLSETLQRDRADLEAIRQLNPDLVDRYQTAANAIRQLESTERRTSFDSNQPQYSAEDFRQQATQARQALQACLTEIRQIPGYETFLTLPTFADIAASLQPSQPLTYLLHTPNGSLALILHLPSPPGRGDVLSLSKEAGGEGITPIWLNDLTNKPYRKLS